MVCGQLLYSCAALIGPGTDIEKRYILLGFISLRDQSIIVWIMKSLRIGIVTMYVLKLETDHFNFQEIFKMHTRRAL